MGTDDPQPHIEVFAGEEIAGDMDAEHARVIGRTEPPGEIGFKTEEIILGEGEIFRISVTDAGAEVFQFAGIAAFAKAGFAGGKGTGRTGRQKKDGIAPIFVLPALICTGSLFIYRSSLWVGMAERGRNLLSF